jgi:hypothetical protein
MDERSKVIAEMDREGIRIPAMSLKRRHAFFQRRFLETYTQREDLRSSVASCLGGSEEEKLWQEALIRAERVLQYYKRRKDRLYNKLIERSSCSELSCALTS